MVTINRYRTKRLLDRTGGVSRYLADDQGHEVTLCVCEDRSFDWSAFGRRLEVLTQIPARLPVARVLDGGVCSSGAWAVYERPRGRSWAELFKSPQHPRRLSEQVSTAQGAMEVIETLTMVHDLGVVHGGLSVRGVLTTEEGRAMIDHLGLPWLMGAPVALGACYHAPEHFEEPAVLDGRTDVYGVGVLLFEMLSGVAPFEGTAIEAMRESVLSMPLQPHAAIPAGMWEVIERATAKRPEERYPDLRTLRGALVQAMLDDLRGLVGGREEGQASGTRAVAVAQSSAARSGVARSGDDGRISSNPEAVITLRSNEVAAAAAVDVAAEPQQDAPATMLVAPGLVFSLSPHRSEVAAVPADQTAEKTAEEEEEPVTLPWVPTGERRSPPRGEPRSSRRALPMLSMVAGVLGLAAGAASFAYSILARPVVIVQPPAPAIYVQVPPAPVASVAPAPSPSVAPSAVAPVSAVTSSPPPTTPTAPPSTRPGPGLRLPAAPLPTPAPPPPAPTPPALSASAPIAAPASPPSPSPVHSGQQKKFAWEIPDPCKLSWYRCRK